MAKFITIKSIVAIRIAMVLEIHQIDVKSEFLVRKLGEDNYKEQPQRFIEEDKHYLVFKLKKLLYYLKQSIRTRY